MLTNQRKRYTCGVLAKSPPKYHMNTSKRRKKAMDEETTISTAAVIVQAVHNVSNAQNV
jgi:hypothetical protein